MTSDVGGGHLPESFSGVDDYVTTNSTVTKSQSFRDLPCIHTERTCSGRACMQGALIQRGRTAGVETTP